MMTTELYIFAGFAIANITYLVALLFWYNHVTKQLKKAENNT